MALFNNNGLTLFGYELKKKQRLDADKEELDKKLKSFVEPNDQDGTDFVINVGGHYGQYIDLDGVAARTERDLILKYRDIAMQPEVDSAIDDIINEAIVSDDDSIPISIVLDDLQVSESIKAKIREEFDKICNLLNFNWKSHDIFRRWYIDGRLYFHKIVDETRPKLGIQEIRYIDPITIKKIREIQETPDQKTGAAIIKTVAEYYVYQSERLQKSNLGLRITPDAITYVTSGVVDNTRRRVLSYLHKALKPTNQLRMMEDSLVIYRLARAPERRLFYIDVGNLPKGKAEEYMAGVMNKHRNKLVYDANTGELKDEKKHMSMLEDFWLPRREGGKGTEVATLPGGQNLGQIDDITYFKTNLYKSLNVPVGRLEKDSPFNIGRSAEISRDELKFQKFINRIRRKFSLLFMDLLYTQLILKGVMTKDEWLEVEQHISIDFKKDNHFTELKNAEILKERLGVLATIDPYIGRYYSTTWVRQNVLKQTEEEIKEIDKQISTTPLDKKKVEQDDSQYDTAPKE